MDNFLKPPVLQMNIQSITRVENGITLRLLLSSNLAECALVSDGMISFHTCQVFNNLDFSHEILGRYPFLRAAYIIAFVLFRTWGIFFDDLFYMVTHKQQPCGQLDWTYSIASSHPCLPQMKYCSS